MPIQVSPHSKGMMVLFALISLITFSFWSSSGLAKRSKKPRRFPRGCRMVGFSFQHDDLLLTPVRDKSPDAEGLQTLYFFHNISQGNIHLTYKRDPTDITAAKYESDISENRWTSFAVNKSEMTFICSVKSAYDEGYRPVNCQHVLDVCQWNRAKFAEHNRGTYWVSKSKSLRRVLYESIRQNGILLRS